MAEKRTLENKWTKDFIKTTKAINRKLKLINVKEIL